MASTNLMRTIAELLQRFKIPLAIAFLLITAAGVVLSLQVRLEVQAETLLRTDDTVLESLRRHESTFPSAESRFLVAMDLDPPYSAGGEALLESVAAECRAVPGIERVVTPRDAVGGRDPVRSRSLRNLLLSEDLATGALVAFLTGDANDTEGRRRVFEAVHTILDRRLSRDRYAIVGPPFYRNEFVRFIVQDQTIFIPISLAILIVLLTALFRRPLWVLLPLGAVFMTLVWTGGILGLMQRPLTMLTGALPTLLIAIGVTVAIHVVCRYREERVVGGGGWGEAARRTVENVGLPCLLSTVTTMVGFGSLVLARIPDIREFGVLAAIGVGFSFVICIVLLPYVLSAGDRRTPPAETTERTDILGRALGVCCRLASRHPRWMIAGSLALMLVATIGVVQVDMDAYLTDDMGRTTFIFHSYKFFEQRLSSMIPLDVMIESGVEGGLFTPEGREAVARVQAFCQAQPFVDKTLSALDILEDYRTYRPLTATVTAVMGPAPLKAAMDRLNREAPVGPLTDATGTVGRVVVLLQDIGARRSFRFYDAIREFARSKLPPGYRVEEAGVSVIANRVVSSVIEEGARSFLLAFVVIFAVVCILFRSMRTGLLCLLGTLVPIYVGVGAMGVLGIVIRTATVIVGSIALGLAIDLTIHMLGRYRRERAAGRSGDDALHRAMVRTGRPIVVSGGILVLGFGTLGLSRFGLTSEFGIVAAITIFTALVTTLFMLPALLRLGVLRNGRVKGEERGMRDEGSGMRESAVELLSDS